MAIAPHLSVEADATETAPAFIGRLKSISRFVAMWATTCADYWSAAAVYEDLRRLSDAELKRRGLSRDTLARDVCAACERGDTSFGA
jgi:hypothetical protein